MIELVLNYYFLIDKAVHIIRDVVSWRNKLPFVSYSVC